jgi:hypothetical protein
MICLLLDSIVNWKNLMLLTPNNKKYHYKTIYNKFTKWSHLNAFKIYNSLNYIKINHNILDLFIDCTYISNTSGVENVGYNPEYKKKKATKISCLCDKNKNIVSIIECKISTINYIKTVPSTLKNIIIDTSNKNMKKRSSKYNKTKLKKRYLIENVFDELKKFNRIENFMSFIYIARMIRLIL